MFQITMLPKEVINLQAQLEQNELSVEDFFCMINSMYEFEEAKTYLTEILAEIKQDFNTNVWKHDLQGTVQHLESLYRNLYGESHVTVENIEIFQSDDESDAFLSTTDDFYDDGQLQPDESLIAFNLSLKEVTDKVPSIIRKLADSLAVW